MIANLIADNVLFYRLLVLACVLRGQNAEYADQAMLKVRQHEKARPR